MKFCVGRLNKEMVETLFIANSANPNMIQRGLSYEIPIQNQESKVLDPRKAQNIATLLQLLKLTTKDVCQALLDGKIIFTLLLILLL